MKALITGATSGLGKALAEKLAAQGYELALVGRNKEALEQFPSATLFPLDLTNRAEREKLLLWIEKEAPSLVINSAGFGFYGKALSHTLAEHRALIEVNLLALTEITLTAARALQAKKEKGTILNISSAAGLFPFPLFASYAASKSFVTAFSLALAAELKEEGIDILVSCPGPVDTPFRTTAAGRPIPTPPRSFSVEKAVSLLLDQIAKKKPYTIIDWKTHLFAKIGALLPRSFVTKALAKSMEKKI